MSIYARKWGMMKWKYEQIARRQGIDEAVGEYDGKVQASDNLAIGKYTG